jgi:hypothetical protein
MLLRRDANVRGVSLIERGEEQAKPVRMLVIDTDGFGAHVAIPLFLFPKAHKTKRPLNSSGLFAMCKF